MEQPQPMLDEGQMRMIRAGTAVLILLLGLYVALSPAVVYAPTPKVVLYFLISFLPAILFGAEATARFELKLPAFVFVTGGTFAVCLGTLLVLTTLSKPEEQIAVFHIVDEYGQPVALDWDGAVEALTASSGLGVTKFVEGNTLILVFPEQVGEVELQVRKEQGGRPYVGTVTYGGTRTSRLRLGRDLKQDGSG